MSASAKERILKKIRVALTTPTQQPYPQTGTNGQVFHAAEADLDILFAENFTKLQGQFSFCLNIAEWVSQLVLLAAQKGWDKVYCNDEAIRGILLSHGWPLGWHSDIASCQASITASEALVARTGTMVLSATASGGRTPSVYAPTHICLAYTSQLVYNVAEAITNLTEKYGSQLPSLISFASGPSRTADIEKTLVTGVHGPKEVYCFLVEG